jgi:hypothetical protein
MSAALARAHSCFLVALGSDSKIGHDTTSCAATEAVELLIAVARLSVTFGMHTEERRACLAKQLRRRLAVQEDAVLAGEVTYSVWPEHGEKPSAGARQAIARLSRDSPTAESELLSLSIAAVELASLLIRLAANAAASRPGGDAPEQRSAALDGTLGESPPSWQNAIGRSNRPHTHPATSSPITSRPRCELASLRRCSNG